MKLLALTFLIGSISQLVQAGVIGSRQTPDNSLPTCPEENGDFPVYFPHSSDCSLFYQCSNGVPYLFSCPSGLYFDPSINVCNWPSQVQCNITTAKPTEEPITTAKPTEEPVTTAKPTEEPVTTVKPTEEPVTTAKPTDAPTAKTTNAPTAKPTEEPVTTAKPTDAPTAKPTEEPVTTAKPTKEPVTTAKPTKEPVTTAKPTEEPVTTAKPTEEPVTTAKPTEEPVTTTKPTEEPITTAKPTEDPVTTANPTEEPNYPPIPLWKSGSLVSCSDWEYKPYDCEDETILPNGDSQLYFKCQYNAVMLMTCPQNYVFSLEAQMCYMAV